MIPFSCVYFGNFSISDLLYSIIQNPAVRVHVKFKAAELFTNKYGISLTILYHMVLRTLVKTELEKQDFITYYSTIPFPKPLRRIYARISTSLGHEEHKQHIRKAIAAVQSLNRLVDFPYPLCQKIHIALVPCTFLDLSRYSSLYPKIFSFLRKAISPLTAYKTPPKDLNDRHHFS